jgi:hypothetical protein
MALEIHVLSWERHKNIVILLKYFHVNNYIPNTFQLLLMLETCDVMKQDLIHE